MDPAQMQILIADPTGRFSGGLRRVLQGAGYEVAIASTEASALDLARREQFNIVVKSFQSGRDDGWRLMDQLRELSPDTQFIFISEGGSIRTAVDALHHGAFDYLAWPAENEHVLASVRRALEYQAVIAEDPRIRQRLRRRSQVDIFAGTSMAMREVQRVAENVAPTSVTVLIEGESGTGKEIIARAIHERSSRRAKPFVAVNCAALPDNLIESEFFGHVRGAFTGAVADKPGRFELARGGTLFLDEIGDLSLLGQADLLRVLEDGVFRPIGSRTVTRADARIVAASNKPLEELCASGRFREDLLYRLNVITITLPPLRERPEDIPLLVETFSRHFAAKHKRPAKRFEAGAIHALQAFPWPGNVRQLRNIIERLILTIPVRVITREDMPGFLSQPKEGRLSLPAGMTLEQMEKEFIRQTLLKTASNRTEAARLLGISRRTLHYKLQRYGLASSPPLSRPNAS